MQTQYSETCLNQTLSKPKTCLSQTDLTVSSTECLCNLNLCKPNTCLNWKIFFSPKGVQFRQVLPYCCYRCSINMTDFPVVKIYVTDFPVVKIYVTDFPVVKIYVDELSSAQIWSTNSLLKLIVNYFCCTNVN